MHLPSRGKPRLFLAWQALLLVTSAAMAGCASGVSAMSAYTRLLNPPPPAADTAKLDSRFAYLRVTHGAGVSLMVLGYVDEMPMQDTTVWYSSDKEIVRLWRGRVAGTGGLRTDWRSVSFSDIPGWRDALSGNAHYTRQRDVMPGYRVGVRDEVQIQPIAPPADSALKGIPAEQLQWFEERSTPVAGTAPLPPARFAVDLSNGREQVIYSEQCLSLHLCLTLQTWPVATPIAPSPAPSTSSTPSTPPDGTS